MSLKSLPVGAVIVWENQTIPDGWQVCDGTNGTLDLVDRFVMGASVDGDVGVAGGVASHLHSNPSTSERASHNHGGSVSISLGGAYGSTKVLGGTGNYKIPLNHGHGGAVAVTAELGHLHTVGDTGSANNLPPHVKRVYIQRIEV